MLNVGGYLREPYHESYWKAMTLINEADEPLIIYYTSGNIADPGAGYLVLGHAPRMLVLHRPEWWDESYAQVVALWLDQLDTRTTFIHSWYKKETEQLFVDSGTYHTSLWEAEIESLTRPRRLIYDVRERKHFTP